MTHELETALAEIDSGSPPTLRVLKDLIRSIRRGDVPQERHRLEFKRAFSNDTRGWAEIVKDIVAMANFGGGIAIFGIDNNARCLGLGEDPSHIFDPANIANKIRKYASQAAISTSFTYLVYYRKSYGALVILPARRSFIFESDGGYQDDQGRPKKAFWKGVVYTRGPGGNVEANQSQFDAMMDRLAEERVRSLVAKIERVAALPADAELIVRSPAVPDQGYALVTKDSGIPVRIVDEGHREALPVREVLSAAVPFSSMEAEVVAQTRHWRQSDQAHRVQKHTLIRWYLHRAELTVDEESAEFCFVSAGYEHGYAMYWVASMSHAHLREALDREIQYSRYPMRDILPYVVGLYFWNERRTLLGPDGRRVSGRNARNIARRVLSLRDRRRFLEHARFSGTTFTLDGERVRLTDVMNDRDEATALFERILTKDASGTCPANLRQVAHQLDIFLHAPENVRAETVPAPG